MEDDKVIHVTDRPTILALEEAKFVLESSGVRYSDEKIQERAGYYRTLLSSK